MGEKTDKNISEEDSDLISLKEATKYCDYSQDYLSLRARQGKLKAIKIGGVWATKKEWVEDYKQRMKEYKENRGKGEKEAKDKKSKTEKKTEGGKKDQKSERKIREVPVKVKNSQKKEKKVENKIRVKESKTKPSESKSRKFFHLEKIDSKLIIGFVLILFLLVLGSGYFSEIGGIIADTLKQVLLKVGEFTYYLGKNIIGFGKKIPELLFLEGGSINTSGKNLAESNMTFEEVPDFAISNTNSLVYSAGFFLQGFTESVKNTASFVYRNSENTRKGFHSSLAGISSGVKGTIGIVFWLGEKGMEKIYYIPVAIHRKAGEFLASTVEQVQLKPFKNQNETNLKEDNSLDRFNLTLTTLSMLASKDVFYETLATFRAFGEWLFGD